MRRRRIAFQVRTRAALFSAMLALVTILATPAAHAQQNAGAAGRSGDQAPETKATAKQKSVSATRRSYNRQRKATQGNPRPQIPQPAPLSQAEQQRQKDAQLLKLQQADSNLQQQLQDNQLHTLNKTRQAQQNEPRIQSAPTAPPTTPIPGPAPTNRIQDAPAAPPTQTPAPVEPAPQP